MDQMIAKFSKQLREAISIGEKAIVKKHDHEIHHVYVAGLGGSGIGGDFVAELIREECPIPYLGGKGYTIPNYIGKNTLAICSSYSGNTEETLAAFDLLMKTGAKIMVVASGGKLIKAAKDNNLDFIQVPDDWASPRACLGYSLVQQLFILNKLGFIGDEIITQFKSAAALIDTEATDIKEKAKVLAAALNGKMPVLYSTDRIESVTVRWRQQINENAKMLCWHHVIPEMNHNELVGWRDKNENLAVVYLRNEDDLKRNQIRLDINKEILGKYTPNIHEVWSKGANLVEREMYLVHFGDWVSWYLCQLRGMDSIEVDVINYLKGELAKI